PVAVGKLPRQGQWCRWTRGRQGNLGKNGIAGQRLIVGSIWTGRHPFHLDALWLLESGGWAAGILLNILVAIEENLQLVDIFSVGLVKEFLDGNREQGHIDGGKLVSVIHPEVVWREGFGGGVDLGYGEHAKHAWHRSGQRRLGHADSK